MKTQSALKFKTAPAIGRRSASFGASMAAGGSGAGSLGELRLLDRAWDEIATGDVGEGTQASACGLGLLSEVEGLAGVREAAVWTVDTRTTLYRVDGKFWMSEERTLGDPARKTFHCVAAVSVDQARDFLGTHSGIVEMGDVEGRIAELDRKHGIDTAHAEASTSGRIVQ